MKTKKPRSKKQEVPVKEPFSFVYALMFTFRLITYPLYVVYVVFSGIFTKSENVNTENENKKTRKSTKMSSEEIKKAIENVDKELRRDRIIETIKSIPVFPFVFIYKSLFAFPNSYSPLLGAFRFMSFFAIIYYGQTIFYNQREYLEFTSKYLYLNEFFSVVLKLIVLITIVIGFFSSLIVLTGAHSNVKNYSNFINGNYNNIKEAFEFRNGVLGQQTNREKMEEMAKTGFSMYSNYKNPMSENERQATEYLDGQLGMCSTSGKYELLKQLYSGKK